jgi:hypothetical protein
MFLSPRYRDSVTGSPHAEKRLKSGASAPTAGIEDAGCWAGGVGALEVGRAVTPRLDGGAGVDVGDGAPVFTAVKLKITRMTAHTAIITTGMRTRFVFI